MVEPFGEPGGCAAGAREPPQLDGEQRHERDGGHEGGGRRGDAGAEEHRPVQRAGPQGGEDPGPHTDEGDEQRRVPDEQGRTGQPGADERGDVLVELGGGAEVALEDAAEPLRVLHGQRIVQVVLGAQGRHGLGGRGAAVEQERHRVAGCQVDAAEDHEGGHEQHRHQAEEPSDEEAGHFFAAPIVAAQG